MKQMVLGIATLLVIPNVVILWLVARPRPPAAVSAVSEAGIVQIAIKGSEWSIEPAQISLPATGQRVRLIFSNVGTVRHNFVIKELINGEVALDLGQAGSVPKKLVEGAEADALDGLIALPVEPGGLAAVEFTVGQSGTFASACTLKGHERRGMTASVVVP